jgi:ParB family chromosome partitioning protein
MAEVKDADARTMILESEFESVDLSDLIESKRNSRQVFDEKAQADLVESIKRYGVLTPLIVRPVGNAGKYEIIAGARRFRASRGAGLKEVPCRIVKIENDAALEVIVVENLQRENIHPLEEAESFRELLELSNGDKAGLCNRVGKKPSYVEKRLALLSLNEKGRKLFAGGKMTDVHAMLIARLQPSDQEAAIEFLEQDNPSVHALREWIESEVMLDIGKAPWDKASCDLVKKAGSCVACPKRTGQAKDLFDDIKVGDRCTDGECFKSKMQAHIKNLEDSLRGSGHKVYGVWDGYQTKVPKGTIGSGQWLELKNKKDICEKAAIGIVLDHGRAGRWFDICAAPQECKIHGSKGLHGSNDAQREKMRKEMRAMRMDAEVRLRLFKLVNEKQGALEFEDKRVLAEHSFSRLWFAAKVRLAKAMGIEPKKSKYGGKDYETPFAAMMKDLSREVQVDQVLIAITMAGDLDPKIGCDNLNYHVERLKIDRKAVEAEVAEAFKKKAKKMPKTKDESKPKKKGGAKKTAKPSSEPQSKPDPLEHSESDDTE